MTFTPAELKTLPLLTQPEKVAAHRLGVSQSTLKYHKSNILKKAGVRNIPSLVARLAPLGQPFEIMEA
ncbi:LuxR C-terminal-related transcriptional regulator [Roseobacter sp. TSBP12]|uniref:helix-turn-helix transcriptional regulator n=1 Tax=Roseobacter sp. TSBP12 TaxID=1236613 RepID=UPI00125FB7DE|nr:LuxR C-terminal-related transcriptional regulator [Roseobacter sp. TSBP12]KAB6714298.1 hypothetical protein C8029_21400 [Roseobacter sp. TSBP12]